MTLHWGQPPDAEHYREDANSAADAARDRRHFSAKREHEWRVSRALLQAASGLDSRHSITHSHGHAVVASAPQSWLLGVDLERRKPRNLHELAPWFCDPRERAQLLALAAPLALQHFYRLWTFKEAMFKAAGSIQALGFPGALPSFVLLKDASDAHPLWRVELPLALTGQRQWHIEIYEHPLWTCCLAAAAPAGGTITHTRWQELTPGCLPQALEQPALQLRTHPDSLHQIATRVTASAASPGLHPPQASPA